MLLSSFFVLATAGSTIDGRNIEEQWLKDIAEQYDTEVYTANINVDHYNWYGNFGQVVDVRLSESKEGKLTLEGRINPNQYLLQQNQAGQKLFFSAEITPSFADTGKAYLTGLAMTDQPASLGTSQMKFSKGNTGTQQYTALQEFNLELPEEETDTAENLVARLFKKFGGGQQKEFTQKPKDQEETEMSKEALEKLQAQNDKTNATLEKLTGALTVVVEKLTAEPEKVEDPKPKEETEVEKLSKQVVSLQSEIDELKEEVPGKGGQENLGANDQEIVYA